MMKKTITVLLCLVFAVSMIGCGAGKPETVIEGNMKSYSEMPDGTWECNGNTYKYKLEITGRIHGASRNSTFVYLSNLEEITFDQAWKAAGLSSNMNDYFNVKDAVLVELK
ncbi:MAG: immunogenic protein [Lachnospiraceae bacterium]|nr:immunogenic protein [Lachnospiraceae bacterium]